MVDIIKENIQNPGWLTVIVVLITIAIGFSEWITISNIQSFGEIFHIQTLASLMKFLGPVTIATISRGFIK